MRHFSPQSLLRAFVRDDGGDTASAITALAASRLRIELAILAAKLATRQADVDALFRANAELAHTNVRLQNELEETEEKVMTSDENRRIEELQAELSVSRSNEESLRRQLDEVRTILNETEQKLDEFEAEKDKASRSNEAQSRLLEESETLTYHGTRSSASTSLEESAKESVELREEVERLQNVEKLLNERIMCLEDQLLEVEEKFQEVEEECLSEKKKVEALEAEKVSTAREVEQANVSVQSTSGDGSQWGLSDRVDSAMESDLQQQLEAARDEVLILQKELDEARRQLAETSAGDGWGFEGSSSGAQSAQAEIELSRVKEELEEVRKQLALQKQVQRERESSEIERHIREKERIEGELKAVRKELEELQNERDALFAGGDRPDEEWGWGGAQPQNTSEISALRQKLLEMEKIEREQQETIRKQEAKISALEEELSTADTCREELEDASQQVNELQKELREMKKQAQLHTEEQQRLNARIAELESRTENAWGDEWDTTTNKSGEDKPALEQSRSEAYQRIAELELQVEQKVCALVDAEKELTVLRERFEKIATEKSDLQVILQDSSGNDVGAVHSAAVVVLFYVVVVQCLLQVT
ncbi:hypothetical protein COOONC_20547 [Cooperia oncophora]